jgi:hypothetical protein
MTKPYNILIGSPEGKNKQLEDTANIEVAGSPRFFQTFSRYSPNCVSLNTVLLKIYVLIKYLSLRLRE